MRLSLLLILTVSVSCASAPTCPKPAPKPAPVVVRDQLRDAQMQVEALVMAAYEQRLIDSIETGARVQIQVAAIGSTFEEDRAFTAFIEDRITVWLKENIKLGVQSELAASVDGVLEQHVIVSRDAAGTPTALSLLAILKDAKSGRVLASTIAPLSDVQRTPEYLAFRERYTPGGEQEAETRIRIEAVNVSKSFNAIERVSDVESRRVATGNASINATGSYKGPRKSGQATGSGDASVTTSSRVNETLYASFGTSAWYPLQQQVQLNGTPYKLDRDGVFLDQALPPGTYDVTASFREGFWDAAQQQQIEGKKFERSFKVTVRRGENVRVNIVFVCDEKQREIRFTTH